MKKFIAILLAVLMLFSFAACADKTEGNKSDSSAKETEILEAFYSEYYEGEKSGKLIRDFDGDGITDMVAVTCNLFESGLYKELNIHYVKVNEESAREVDILKFEMEEEVPWLRERIELYMNENSDLALNILNCYDGIAADYRVLKITDTEIVIEKHLVDPGYSSALGIFYEEDYLNGQDWDTALYYWEAGEENGKYSSCKEAIETEFKGYGFAWKLWDECNADDIIENKYIIEKTDNVELVFEHEQEVEYSYY